MATNTTNYALVKPALGDFVDISVINANMDKIDTELKRQNDVDTLKVATADIVNNCTSTATNKPLSAYQGKVLDDKINSKSQINDTTASTTSTYSSSKVDTLLSGKSGTGHTHTSGQLPSTVAYKDGTVQTNLNADKLDGYDATAFASSGHDHNSSYLGINAKASNSALINGKSITISATAPTSKAVGDLWISF